MPIPRAFRRDELAVHAALAVGVLAVFGRAVGFGFVAIDDPTYVSENARVLAGPTLDGLRWALTSTDAGNWHPLTWWSLMTDAAIGGGHPGVFHATSVGLHLVNCLLVFHLLARATGATGRSALVAALFAVHPLRVESVVWIAERKDVLSATMGLLALLAYARYVRRPGWAPYAAALGLFALGLAAKPMLVTLPLAMLLLDYWPLRRAGPSATAWDLRRLIGEKLPFLALAAVAAGVTFRAQSGSGAVSGSELLPFATRGANAVVSAVAYLLRAVWPFDLALPYPYDPARLSPVRVALASAVLVGLTLVALRGARRRPYFAVGWLGYLVGLMPVIGLVQVGAQSMADRYTYAPLAGVFLAAVWGAADRLGGAAGESRPRRAAGAAAASLLLAALAVRAWDQVGVWRTTESLFAHAVRVTGPNAVARGGLGLALAGEGRLDEAIAQNREAIRIAPTYVEARANLAAALLDAGRLPEAAVACDELVALRPGEPSGEACRGAVRLREGRFDDAVRSLEEAIRLGSSSATVRIQLGLALSAVGRDDEGLARLLEAERLRPLDPAPRVAAASLLAKRGDLPASAERLLQALRLAPRDLAALRQLGVIRARQGRLDDAITLFDEVLRVDPADEGTRRNLERARSLRSSPAGPGRER